jgi:hypothetical protein
LNIFQLQLAVDTEQSGDRKRICSAVLASVLLNITAFAILSAHLSSLHRTANDESSEVTIGSPLHVLIERRTPQPPKPRPPRRVFSSPPQAYSLSPPQPAALALPPGWSRQDFGNKAATDTTLWLDWTKQAGDFVPRVFLWQTAAAAPYMRRPSLRDAVQDVLSALHAEDATVFASRAQRVCGGARPGWFLSYVKSGEDPPLHFDETLFMSGQTIYRATYIRPANQPEDAKTREALNTLCS